MREFPARLRSGPLHIEPDGNLWRLVDVQGRNGVEPEALFISRSEAEVALAGEYCSAPVHLTARSFDGCGA